MRDTTKKPLYRRVNTRTHGVNHDHGSDYKRTKTRDSRVGMRQGIQRGLDYTPLFRFLLSKVGGDWNRIYSEAVARLDKDAPIFWLVAKNDSLASAVVRLGESSYYSGLVVDDDGILQLVDPGLNEDSLAPECKCCTHTFNGILFSQKWQP